MGATVCVGEWLATRLGYWSSCHADAIDARWAPVDERAALRARFVEEMVALREQHGLAPRFA